MELTIVGNGIWVSLDVSGSYVSTIDESDGESVATGFFGVGVSVGFFDLVDTSGVSKVGTLGEEVEVVVKVLPVKVTEIVGLVAFRAGTVKLVLRADRKSVV